MEKRVHYRFTIEELREMALTAWRQNAKEYRNLLPMYEELLAKKRWLKEHEPGYRKMPLHKIPKRDLNDFVQVPFFDLKTENDVVKYIETLDYRSLNNLLTTIRDALSRHVYITLKSRIYDFGHQIRYYPLTQTAKKAGYDPTYPISSGQRFTGRMISKHPVDSGE